MCIELQRQGFAVCGGCGEDITLHLMGAIPNAGPFVEFSIEDTPWTRDLYAPSLEVRDGRVAVRRVLAGVLSSALPCWKKRLARSRVE